MDTPMPPLLLLVDDSPEIALIVQRFAREAGHVLATCGDVPSAWEYLGQARPDLLILDVNLPGENGLVLCRRIRATPEFKAVPIALFSDWERAEDITAGLRAGADFVLSKELLCRPDAWQNRIAELLGPADSRLEGLSLSLKKARELKLTAERAAAGLNRALRRPELTVLSPDIVRMLLERAAAHVDWQVPHGWLNRAGRGLCDENLAGSGAEQVMNFAVALADQLWRVVGHIASSAFTDTMLTALSGMGEPRDK